MSAPLSRKFAASLRTLKGLWRRIAKAVLVPGSPPKPAKAAGEAVETAICLAEVASDRAAAGGRIWPPSRSASKEANPDCWASLKLVTGAGKTTVMTTRM